MFGRSLLASSIFTNRNSLKSLSVGVLAFSLAITLPSLSLLPTALVRANSHGVERGTHFEHSTSAAHSTNAAHLATCPFCSAVAQTLTEELTTNDVAVIAKMLPLDPSKKKLIADAADVTKANFEVLKVLKGEEFVAEGATIETVVFGDAAENETFFVMGVDPPRTVWSSPIQINAREQAYVISLMKLPVSGPKRMSFFLNYLEDESAMLAADAYDEFARAPYADVLAIKDEMDHEQLVKWIQNEDIPASRKRLYLTMLGVCGSNQDLPMLEELMKSPDRRKRAGLDAMIACYLTLKGEEGLATIEDLFLKNAEAEYADTYAAITALRFHGSEEDKIPLDRIKDSLELMLKRPKLADLVIPDLARWKDWDVMDELVTLFKEADDSTNWVRVPVVNYLRACPLPEAKEHLAELEKIDPEAIKRANTFFPLLDANLDDDEETDDDASGDEASAGETKASEKSGVKKSDSDDQVRTSLNEDLGEELTAETDDIEYVSTLVPTVGDQVPPRNRQDQQVAQLSVATDTPLAAANNVLSPWAMLASSFAACAALMLVIWGLLTGRLVALMS